MMLCPLCQSQVSEKIEQKLVPGSHFHCGICDLIFKDPALHLNWGEQKIRYDLHNNQETPEYIRYFEKLLGPLRPHLKPGQSILDWGSGPEPVLSKILRREGFSVDIFDPVYHPEISKSLYDVVISTEVIEHFQEPLKSFNSLFSRLSGKGLFAGMTNFHSGVKMYFDWWYAKDPTHVVFYSEKTMKWIAQKWGCQILLLASPVFIFQKN